MPFLLLLPLSRSCALMPNETPPDTSMVSDFESRYESPQPAIPGLKGVDFPLMSAFAPSG
ncbi:hypothetical protein DSECCO2_445630 [anaerobic digester metagenome]